MLTTNLQEILSMLPDTPATVGHSSPESPVVEKSRADPATHLPFDGKERLRLMWNGVVNYSGFVSSGVAGLILVPVMLHYLGSEAYGLWLAAMAVWGMLGSCDFGLSWSITREVSSSLGGALSNDCRGFVAAAGNLYLWLGLVGGAAIAILGWPFARGLHLSGYNRAIAPEVFLFVAGAFAAERLVLFSTAVLAGLRCFGTINAIAVGASLARLIGSLALLWTGRTILAIAIWNAILCVAWALASLACVHAIEPRLRFLLGRWRWQFVRPHLTFGLSSFLTALAAKLIWDTAPLLIGFLSGSAAIVPFSIGQRFPVALNHVNERVAETIFPAASERMARNDWEGSRGVLQLGTRWILVTALPAYIIFWVLAPNLLQVWVGEFTSEAALIMRLTCAAVLAQGIGMGAMQVLWGRGAVRTIVTVLGLLALPGLVLTAGLIWVYGEVGAATALCVVLLISAGWFLYLGARSCQLPLTSLLRDTFRGLLLPTLACAAIAYAGVALADPKRWMSVLLVSFLAAAAYVGVLYFTGARQEEREFVRQALGL